MVLHYTREESVGEMRNGSVADNIDEVVSLVLSSLLHPSLYRGMKSGKRTTLSPSYHRICKMWTHTLRIVRSGFDFFLNYSSLTLKKTCSLFYLSGIISAEIAQLSESEKSVILEYLRHVGLLFQLVDDYLDVNNDNKYNLAKSFGPNKIKLKIEEERNQAIRQLEQLEGDASILKMIVEYIVSRCVWWI